MLKIRLSRFGKKSYPIYKIVVVDARKPRNSDFIGLIGRYEPMTKVLVFDKEEYQKYISFGAQPTEIVSKLYKNLNKTSQTVSLEK